MSKSHKLSPVTLIIISYYNQFTAAWLALVDERLTTVREVGVQDPNQTQTQGLKITEESVLPLLWYLQAVRHSSLLG